MSKSTVIRKPKALAKQVARQELEQLQERLASKRSELADLRVCPKLGRHPFDHWQSTEEGGSHPFAAQEREISLLELRIRRHPEYKP